MMDRADDLHVSVIFYRTHELVLHATAAGTSTRVATQVSGVVRREMGIVGGFQIERALDLTLGNDPDRPDW